MENKKFELIILEAKKIIRTTTTPIETINNIDSPSSTVATTLSTRPNIPTKTDTFQPLQLTFQQQQYQMPSDVSSLASLISAQFGSINPMQIVNCPSWPEVMNRSASEAAIFESLKSISAEKVIAAQQEKVLPLENVVLNCNTDVSNQQQQLSSFLVNGINDYHPVISSQLIPTRSLEFSTERSPLLSFLSQNSSQTTTYNPLLLPSSTNSSLSRNNFTGNNDGFHHFNRPNQLHDMDSDLLVPTIDLDNHFLRLQWLQRQEELSIGLAAGVTSHMVQAQHKPIRDNRTTEDTLILSYLSTLMRNTDNHQL